ncbi:DUF4179 domain-containing protein [Halobacillus trueperi]|uniref:DUF4179 domain-containing protein n=1 Tax=Halobacillus trueperi TaxID=156205 RepID=A0A3E0IYH1_9BACI|nr:DUF4179 domain-containing protein [Halobacillus trueperi]REJ05631.1 DUF4179 domain-containing protein [Halobacillus trueperi]
MEDLFKQARKEYENNQYTDEQHKRIKQNVHNALTVKPKPTRKRNNFVYIASAAAIFMAILIGTSFLSPTVSDVMAKIPIIGAIFDSEDVEPVSEDIQDLLNSKNVKVHAVNNHVLEKTYEISIEGGDRYFNTVSEKVKNQVENLLEDKGLTAYKVDVVQYTGQDIMQLPEKVTKDEKMLSEEKQIKEKLAEKGYSPGLAFYLPTEEIFTVGVKMEKETFQNNYSELNQEVSSLINSFGRENYNVEVFRYIEGTVIEKVSYDTWGDMTGHFAAGRKQQILNSYLEDEADIKGEIDFSFSPDLITIYADNKEMDVRAVKEALPEKLETVTFGTLEINFRVMGGDEATKETIALDISRKLTIALAGQEGLHVKNVGANYKNDQFNIYVNTTLNEGDNTNGTITKLENQIYEYFNSSEGKEFLNNEEYQVIFKDKEGNSLP